jgi:nucleotide-binding universal stress UspA family protein
MSRIVVGVDGSPNSATALRWALREAQLRGGQVEAVIAWQLPAWFVIEAGGRLELSRLATELEQDARKALHRCVRDALRVSRGVPVDEIVVRDAPAKVLLEIAKGADLLVVGSRGRAGFAGLLLGSVSTACVSHAPCPVVVVHPDPASCSDPCGDGAHPAEGRHDDELR